MTCKGICIKYKAKKQPKGHYAVGHKRCQNCDLFIDVGDEIRCPCCRYILRSKPRKTFDKERLKINMELKN